MSNATENLQNLLKLVKELSSRDELEWFKKDLKDHFNITENGDSSKIDDIYQHCIQEIIKQQANLFYSDFKINEIKPVLIKDFTRMEQFRREDKFEEFCLALFQQIENITNYLFENYNIGEQIKQLQNVPSLMVFNKIQQRYVFRDNSTKLGKLIFQKYRAENFDVSNQKWYFNNKLRAVIYYYYFDQKITISEQFENVYTLGNHLYLIRNLNHRGGNPTEYQKKIYDSILPIYNKYYFKFLGFLEDFISKINENIDQ